MRERGLLLGCARSYNDRQMQAAKEKTVSAGEALPQAKTCVWGLPLENANGIGVLRPASSTLHWGWSALYAGTVSGELDQRYYGVGTGRFGTPDPSGSAASDMENPTSWNMYAYVNGDPVNFSDPEGLDCASTPYYYNGKYQGTVGSIIGADSDISTLATAMYTESGHGSKVDVIDEEYAIGAVIMNRWQFVNKNWYLSSSPGGASLSVSGWGTPGDSISSIVKNPSQFAIYTRNADGSVSLSASAQRNLDSALKSNANSSGCEDLAWAITLANGMWGSRNDGDLWLYNGLILTGFNSFNPAHSSAPYEQKAGSFGDANTFYGVPDSYVSETKIAPPRRRPPAPPRPRPRVPGEQQ